MADEEPAAPVVFKKRPIKKNSTMRKAPAQRAPSPSASSSSSSSASASDSESGRTVKKRRLADRAVVKASTADQKPKSTYEGASTHAGDATATALTSAQAEATKTATWFDETDAASLLGKTRTSNHNPNPALSSKPKSFLKTNNPNADNEPKKTVGPQKATGANVRTITITDYAPDVCKDYKQTGFCGFGDSCKFLHAREDYAAGWQLDREWELAGKDKNKNKQKGKEGGGVVISSAARKKGLSDSPSDDDANEEETKALMQIPFACLLCKRPYTRPVLTRCGHYFCEACALRRYRRHPACAACGADTRGVFNAAKMLQRLLERKRERIRRRRERGEDVEGEEGEEGDVGGDGEGGERMGEKVEG